MSFYSDCKYALFSDDIFSYNLKVCTNTGLAKNKIIETIKYKNSKKLDPNQNT